MKRVLVSEPIHQDGIELLRARDDVEVILADNSDPTTLARLIPGVHGIAVRTAKLSADLLSLGEDLEVVSRHGVGCDNVDVAHLSKRSIPVAIAAGANSTSVAELTFAMMLTLTRRLRDLDQAVRANNFSARSKLLAMDSQNTISARSANADGARTRPIMNTSRNRNCRKITCSVSFVSCPPAISTA